MTCSYDLYKKAGGIIHYSGAVALNVDTSTTSIIAAVAGKRIVPVWAVHVYTNNLPTNTWWFLGGLTSLHYVVYGQATIASNRIAPQIFRFHGNELRTLEINEGLSHAYLQDYTGKINTAYCSVGYYLLDS